MTMPSLFPTNAVSGLVRVSNYYDRNPKTLDLNYANTLVGGSQYTLLTYTAPAGRKAMIEALSFTAFRPTSAGVFPASGSENFTLLQTANAGIGPQLIIMQQIWGNSFNTQGSVINLNQTQLGILYPGDILNSTVALLSEDNVGRVNVTYSVKLTEFDA